MSTESEVGTATSEDPVRRRITVAMVELAGEDGLESTTVVMVVVVVSVMPPP